MEARLAEIHLKKVQQEQALKAQEQALKAEEQRVCSEREILEAETELEKAKIRLQTVEELPDLDDMEPALSATDRVGNYLKNLETQHQGHDEPLAGVGVQSLNPLASLWLGASTSGLTGESSEVQHSQAVSLMENVVVQNKTTSSAIVSSPLTRNLLPLQLDCQMHRLKRKLLFLHACFRWTSHFFSFVFSSKWVCTWGGQPPKESDFVESAYNN